MEYQKSLTKRELLKSLEDVPDDHEIFVVKDGHPLWLFSDIVDVAVETEEGQSVLLDKAVGILSCDEKWFD